LGGCLCSFLHGRKLKNKEKKQVIFYIKEDQEKTLEHPLSLLLPPFPLPFSFPTTISSMNNFNLEFFFKVKQQ
jgi:hypothetical protein